jgi:ketosteroid isomerase-like protein
MSTQDSGIVRLNADVARGVYDAWRDGDVTRALAFLDPEVVWEAIPDAPDAGTYRGHAGARRYMEDWLGDFDIHAMDFQEVIEAEDRLVVVQCARATGKGSGVETRLNYAVAYWFRDDRILAIKEFRTKGEAIEAPGPSA